MSTKKIVFGCIGGFYFFDLFYDNFKYILYPSLKHSTTYGRDSYVLVTGASDGIGKEFAKNFASLGFNIVLLSRNRDKLINVAKDIRDTYGSDAIVYPMDLANAKEEDFIRLAQDTEKLDISILVNNAGMVKYKHFHEMTYADIDEIVNLNCLAGTRLMHYFLPRLAKRADKSAVINVSSIVGIKPTPVISLYSATKGFSHYLSVGLSQKYDGKVDIMSYVPANVDTGMAISDSSPIMITPKKAVNECLKDLGVKTVSYGHWKHTFAAYIIELLPQPIRLKILSYSIGKEMEELNNKSKSS